MTAPTSSTINQELAPRLRLAVMRLARRLRQQAEAGISPSMLSALAQIEYRGSVTLGELADFERVSPPTMTKIVARLEEQGLVERTTDPSDRRVAHVRLSPRGRQLVARNRSAKNAYLARRLRRLSPEEVERLERAVEVIEKLLEDDRP